MSADNDDMKLTKEDAEAAMKKTLVHGQSFEHDGTKYIAPDFDKVNKFYKEQKASKEIQFIAVCMKGSV